MQSLAGLMNDWPPQRRRRPTWPQKFWFAIRGIALAFRTQTSFYVHLPVAAVVLLLCSIVSLDLVSWCLILLCIGVVLAAELFNTALEYLAQAITLEDNESIRGALDVASGAVLITSVTAAIVGSVVFTVAVWR